jgi:hypothetical protein
MSLAAKARLGGQALRLGGHVAVERFAGPRDGAVPTSAADLTPEWLTGVLLRDHPDAHVESVALGDANDGTTSRLPFTVVYDEAGAATGLPACLFAKFSDRFASRMLLGPVGAIRNEAEFYRRVRPGLDVAAPRAFHVVYDERSWRSMFVMEDVGASRGATFCDAKVHVTRADAESMVANLAALHRRFWASPRLRSDHPWLQSFRQMQLLFNDVAGFERRTLVGFDRAGDDIPALLRSRRADLYPAAMRSMEINERSPPTFLHNDTHIGNWFRTADGQMGLYDWQATVRGSWASDVAYALSSALTIEDRRAWERDLLDLYLLELGRTVTDPPGRERAWMSYRQQIFHALIYWLFTLGEGPLQPAMQPRDIAVINVRRMAQATVDLDAFAAVGRA